MIEHYDALETRDHTVRETALMTALPTQVAHARDSSAAFQQILQGRPQSRNGKLCPQLTKDV